MKRLNQEHIIGIVCLLIAAVTIYFTAGFPRGQREIQVSGPALFPNVLAAILAGCGIVEIIIGFVKSGSFPSISLRELGAALKRRDVQNAYCVLLCGVLYILLFDVLGFFITSFLFLFAVMFRLGVAPVKNVLVSAAFLAVIYVIFGLLFTISLPAGVLSVIGM